MDLAGGIGLFLAALLAVTVTMLGIAVVGFVIDRIAKRQEEGSR
jgi:hypothetical protein